MAVTFEGAGTFVAGLAAITPGMPANIQANDILLLFIETANQAPTLTTANGFAIVGTATGTGTAGNAAATRIDVYWKRAVGGGADAAPIIGDSGDHQAARIGLWRGVKTSGNPWNVAPVWTVDATSDTTGNPLGVTTTVPNCGVIIACSNTADTNTPLTLTYTNAALTGLAATGMGDNTNSGGGGGFNVGFGIKDTAGAVGTSTIGYSTASQKSMVVIALQPAFNLNLSVPVWQTDIETPGVTANLSDNLSLNVSAWEVLVETPAVGLTLPENLSIAVTAFNVEVENQSLTFGLTENLSVTIDPFEIQFESTAPTISFGDNLLVSVSPFDINFESPAVTIDIVATIMLEQKAFRFRLTDTDNLNGAFV